MNYDSDVKASYRTRRDMAIATMSRQPLALRRVAYLDTQQALDTITRLRNGYRPENLFAVNKNPAIVAHLTMKLKAIGLPLVNTIGADIASDRVPSVDVIDFDGMSYVNTASVEIVKTLVRRMVDGGVLAVTILGGREGVRDNRGHRDLMASIIRVSHQRETKLTHHTSFGTPVRAMHYERMRAMLWAATIDFDDKADEIKCGGHVTDLKWDFYTSPNGQAMVWFVASVNKHSDEWTQKYINNLKMGRGPITCGISKHMVKLGILPSCLGGHNFDQAVTGMCRQRSDPMGRRIDSLTKNVRSFRSTNKKDRFAEWA